MQSFIQKIILTLVVIATACSSDSNAESALLKKLAHTWIVSTVSLGGVVQEGYDDFSISLSGSARSSVFAFGVFGRPEISPWPAEGNWTFGNQATSELVRNPGTSDELVIRYTVTDTTLTMEFDYTGEGFASSRVASAEGRWTFTFTRSK